MNKEKNNKQPEKENVVKKLINQYKNSVPLKFSIFYKKQYNDIRRLKVIELLNIMQKYEFFRNKTYDEKTEIVRCLEVGCLNESIRKAKEYNVYCVWSNYNFSSIYHSICFKLLSNLDFSSSVHSMSLINMIENGDVELKKIANMNSKELCPEKYVYINEKINKRNNLERKLKYSELHRCRKCKKNQCTLEKRFNRSLDEGVNLTINCLFCGHSWCA